MSMRSPPIVRDVRGPGGARPRGAARGGARTADLPRGKRRGAWRLRHRDRPGRPARDHARPQTTSRSATTASPSRSRSSTTARSRSASSSCSTSPGAWRAICRCCAAPPSSSSSGSCQKTWRASGRLATRSRSARLSRATANELLAALPAAIMPNALTPLWRALTDAIEAFGEGNETRKVILVLSDGKDTGPIDFRKRPASQADVIDRARLEDVMIYAVGLRSRPRPGPPGIGPGGPSGDVVRQPPRSRSRQGRRRDRRGLHRDPVRAGPGGSIRRGGRRAPHAAPSWRSRPPSATARSTRSR